MTDHILDTIAPAVLGKRLRAARRACGLTLQENAASLGVACTAIAALEKGNRRIQPGELWRLARLYGCPLRDFTGVRASTADFPVQCHTDPAHRISPPQQQELVRALYAFQRLYEDYLWLEELNGVSSARHYRPAYTHNPGPEAQGGRRAGSDG